jgi:hypothetical protein
LDCTILSLPLETALSIPEQEQAGVIDDWIMQIAEANEVGMGGAQFDVGGAIQEQQEQQEQGYDAPGSGSGYFDYAMPMLGMSQPQQQQQSQSAEEANISAPVPSAASYLEVASLRSRSPSISPHHEFFTTFNNPHQLPPFHYLEERMSAPQQSMYINGRGFYSDPYLSNTSHVNANPQERGASSGYGMIDTGVGMGFLPPPPPPPPPPGLLEDLDYPLVTNETGYAISNPDSDISSSPSSSSLSTTFDSSSSYSIGGDFRVVNAGTPAPPPPPPPPPGSVHHSTLQVRTVKRRHQRQGSLSVSVSPVPVDVPVSMSFEDVRTLY